MCGISVTEILDCFRLFLVIIAGRWLDGSSKSSNTAKEDNGSMTISTLVEIFFFENSLLNVHTQICIC